MKDTLQKYLPERSVDPILGMIKAYNIQLKIVNQRQTKHGDYRLKPDGFHQITVVIKNLYLLRFAFTVI